MPSVVLGDADDMPSMDHSNLRLSDHGPMTHGVDDVPLDDQPSTRLDDDPEDPEVLPLRICRRGQCQNVTERNGRVHSMTG